MTTTTTEREAEPCWVLIDSAGRLFDNGDGVPHYPTKAEAQADSDYEQDYTPRQREHSCVTIAPCGRCTGYLGAFPVSHFDTQAAADKAVLEAGWILSNGTVTCEECVSNPDCLAEAVAASAEGESL